MFLPLAVLVLAAHRSVPTGPACKKAPESSTPEQTCYLQPCCHPQVKPTRRTALIFHREIISDELSFTSSQPPSTHMKSMFKSLPPLVSLCTSFILPLSSLSLHPSVWSSFIRTFFYGWQWLMTRTSGITHPSVHPSLFPLSSRCLKASHPRLLFSTVLDHIWRGLMLPRVTACLIYGNWNGRVHFSERIIT